MNKLNAFFAGAALVTVLSTSHLQAAVVYQSIPDITVAVDTFNWCASCSGFYAPVDQFTLLDNASITGFNLAADSHYGNLGIGTLGVTLYDGSLSSILFQQTVTSTLVTATGNGTNIVTGALTGLNLTAGTYRISFFAVGANMTTPGFYGGNGTLVQVASPNSTNIQIIHNGENIGYQLLGEVALTDIAEAPEPSSWALVSLGAAALGLSRRKFGKV